MIFAVFDVLLVAVNMCINYSFLHLFNNVASRFFYNSWTFCLFVKSIYKSWQLNKITGIKLSYYPVNVRMFHELIIESFNEFRLRSPFVQVFSDQSAEQRLSNSRHPVETEQ